MYIIIITIITISIFFCYYHMIYIYTYLSHFKALLLPGLICQNGRHLTWQQTLLSSTKGAVILRLRDGQGAWQSPSGSSSKSEHPPKKKSSTDPI